MTSRTGKQCKERYFNHLDPDMEKLAWTLGENTVIRDMFPQFGTDWSLYIKFLPGRSNKAIKSRYHAMSPNNFQCCCIVEGPTGHAAASHKRGAETTCDSDDGEEPSRKRLRKLIADRAAMDLEIFELERLCALDNDQSSLTSCFSNLSTGSPSSLSHDNFADEFRVDTL